MISCRNNKSNIRELKSIHTALNINCRESFEGKREYAARFVSDTRDGRFIEEYRYFHAKYGRPYPKDPQELGWAIYFAIAEDIKLKPGEKIANVSISLYSDTHRARRPLVELVDREKWVYREVTIKEAKTTLRTLDKLFRSHLDKQPD